MINFADIRSPVLCNLINPKQNRMTYVRKIINDPVHGFITIDDPLIFEIISHPYYQRLRRIHQMAFASLVYPGAVHTRLHHSLGAYHLMGLALNELRNKGIEITKEEEQAAKIAILLHDVGHGPYSHALEKKLIRGVHHEDISILILQLLNEQFNGKLKTAIEIFTDEYHKRFLHQLISGQLDVDRDRDNNPYGGGWFSKNPAEVQQRFGGRWLTTEFQAGDALVFTMFTLHCSLDNTSNRIRLSTDSRYQLASAPIDERWVEESIAP